MDHHHFPKIPHLPHIPGLPSVHHHSELTHLDLKHHNTLQSHGLSWKNRIKGYLVCFILGNLLTLGGSLFLAYRQNGLQIFAACFCIGNLLCIFATCFLRGPIHQLKVMFSPARRLATSLVLLFLSLALFSAFVLKDEMITIAFVCCEALALSWYSFTSIPFAKKATKVVVKEAVHN